MVMWSTEALVMNMNEPVKPGIYRHFKGNLYFVRGLSFDGNDPTNFHLATVEYHPLYSVPNQGWRHRLYSEFFENVDKPGFNYSGPRFQLIHEPKRRYILDMILPGKQVRTFSKAEPVYTVSGLFIRDGIIFVKVCSVIGTANIDLDFQFNDFLQEFESEF